MRKVRPTDCIRQDECFVTRSGYEGHGAIDRPRDPDAAGILDEVLGWLAKDQQMQRDRKQLASVCCAPQPPVQLRGAPRPSQVTSR